jgi:hypothetical protein
MHIRFIYFFILLIGSVNSRLFGKILFGRYFSNFLQIKSYKNKLFNNIIYKDVKNSLNLNTTEEIDIILENIDNEIYDLLEQIFYNII